MTHNSQFIIISALLLLLETRMNTEAVPKSAEKLSLKTKLLYGIGDSGNSLMVSAISFYLMKFYTDAALIAPALAGSALMIGKFWDSFNDPLFGWLSDKVRSPVGHRRIFMFAGAIPFGVAGSILWFVPHEFSPLASFIWITLTFMAWGTLWTITNVPYGALLADLTDDYDERTRLVAVRTVFSVSGFIIGAVLTPVIVASFHSQRFGYGMAGLLFGVFSATVLLICASGIRERKFPRSTEMKIRSPLKAAFQALGNKPFRLLFIAFSFCNFAFALVKTLLVYLLTYQFFMGSKMPLVMLVMMGSVAAFLFPWKFMAEKFEKGPAYAFGLAIGAASIIAAFFLPHHQTYWVYLIAVAAGIGFSSNWILPWAMIPDVVEIDRAKSGEQRSGVYFGLWGLAFKFSEALGIIISGWVLQLFHYVPNVPQTSTALLGIRLFSGPIPAIIFIAMIPLFLRYPVTRKMHGEIRKTLG